ncbi:MAG: hypothetical protein O2819_04845 [Planctomycetota bacterium]|nr:hypothetical protein [Planctomycetota bacterium]
MLKFFRENERIGKWIMVCGLVLLLISWLAFDYSSNSILSDWLDGRRTWAVVGKEEVSAADLRRSQQQLAMLEALGSPLLGSLSIDKEPGHWFLLVREATQAGLVGPPSEGESALVARLQGQPDADPNLVVRQLMGASGLSRDEVLETLAEEAAVMRLVSMVGGAGSGRVAPVRLRQEAARRLLALQGEVMLIDAGTASAGSAPFADPTDEQLAEQLSKHGAQPAGTGDSGFGYQIADRVRYEWLSIPVTTVSASIERGPDLSNIALRKYFLENEAQFVGPNTAIAAAKPEFEQYREAVRRALLTTLTKDRSADIAKFATDRLGMQLRGAVRTGGHVTLPADWSSQQLSLEALADDIAQRFSIATPIVVAASDAWIAPADLASVPGLGAATTDAFGGRGVRPSDLAAALKEFGGNPTLIAQSGVAMPVFSAPSGDIFIARITDAQAAHAPQSIDEVRAELTRDVKRLENFAVLEGQLDSIKSAAATDFAAAAVTYGAQTAPFTDLRISNPQFLQYGIEFGTPLPLVGTAMELQDDLVAAAMKLPADSWRGTGDPLGVGASGSSAAIPAAERTFTFVLPKQLAVAVVRIDAVTAMDEVQLAEAMKGNGLRGIVGRQGADNPFEPFTFPAMRVRHQFVPLAEKPGEATAGAPTTADGTEGAATAGATSTEGAK